MASASVPAMMVFCMLVRVVVLKHGIESSCLHNPAAGGKVSERIGTASCCGDKLSPPRSGWRQLVATNTEGGRRFNPASYPFILSKPHSCVPLRLCVVLRLCVNSMAPSALIRSPTVKFSDFLTRYATAIGQPLFFVRASSRNGRSSGDPKGEKLTTALSDGVRLCARSTSRSGLDSLYRVVWFQSVGRLAALLRLASEASRRQSR